MQEEWQASPYTIWLNPNDDEPMCQVVAEDVPFDEGVRDRMKVVADMNYEYRLMLDDLPSATIYRRGEPTTNSEARPIIEYDYGIPVAHRVIERHGPSKDEL